MARVVKTAGLARKKRSVLRGIYETRNTLRSLQATRYPALTLTSFCKHRIRAGLGTFGYERENDT